MKTDRERIEQALRAYGDGGLVIGPFNEVDASLDDVVGALLPLLEEVRLRSELSAVDCALELDELDLTEYRDRLCRSLGLEPCYWRERVEDS